tara:strand:- start:66 stop:287 length:222 start_codon:yes stop_codon:yes gene_type:complete
MELYTLLRAKKSSHLFEGGSWVSVMTQKFIERKHIRASLHTLLAPAPLNNYYYFILTIINRLSKLTETKMEET